MSGGCFFGVNETSDAGESPILIGGFSGTFALPIYRLPYADLLFVDVVRSLVSLEFFNC
jgi:hypothetical protein